MFVIAGPRLADDRRGQGYTARPRVLARLYLLDEDGKIKAEQVIFYAAPD